MSAFLMPSLGADMEAGTLVEQLVSPGNAVRHGDIIAAVETQKGVIEIEAFEDGILEEWLVELGRCVSDTGSFRMPKRSGAGKTRSTTTAGPCPVARSA